MNIKEAYTLQGQTESEIQNLHIRLLESVLVRKGEKPVDNPTKLQHEIDTKLHHLTELYDRVSNTISKTHVGDKLFMEAYGEAKVMDLRISLLEGCLKKASEVQVGYEPVVDTVLLKKRLATLRELKRDMDVKLIAVMQDTEV